MLELDGLMRTDPGTNQKLLLLDSMLMPVSLIPGRKSYKHAVYSNYAKHCFVTEPRRSRRGEFQKTIDNSKDFMYQIVSHNDVNRLIIFK